MTDLERVDSGVITFDGAGNCTTIDSEEDLVARTIGEPGTFSNFFTDFSSQQLPSCQYLASTMLPQTGP